MNQKTIENQGYREIFIFPDTVKVLSYVSGKVLIVADSKRFITDDRVVALGSNRGEAQQATENFLDAGYTHYVTVLGAEGETIYIGLYSQYAQEICSLVGQTYFKGYGNSCYNLKRHLRTMRLVTTRTHKSRERFNLEWNGSKWEKAKFDNSDEYYTVKYLPKYLPRTVRTHKGKIHVPMETQSKKWRDTLQFIKEYPSYSH